MRTRCDETRHHLTMHGFGALDVRTGIVGCRPRGRTPRWPRAQKSQSPEPEAAPHDLASCVKAYAPIVCPPIAGSTTPVMKLLSASDAKNTYAGAISSGW